MSAAPAPAPAVTVVVVSWNTRELLRACLASLEPEVRSGRAAVRVVDNASHDGSAAMVREEFGWAQLDEPGENLGFGAAVNRGAAGARSPWLAVANADVALEPGALDALLAAGARDPGAGALAPRLVAADGSAQHSVHPFPTVPFTLLFNLGAGRLSRRWAEGHVLLGAWDAERERRVPWAVAAFLLVRRAAFEQAGCFDERQWMYAEDLDLGWRLARAGHATRYVPAARVRHAGGAATAQAWGGGATERWQHSTYAWLLRRRGPLRTRVVAAANVGGALARWAPLAVAARVAPKRYAPRRDALRGWARTHAVGLRPGALREHR